MKDKICILLLLCLWGCKNRPYQADAGLRSDIIATEQRENLLGQLVLPDIPPSGRSLFDKIYYGSTPKTFEELTSAIKKATGDEMVAVLIPYGRSLQRLAAYPQRFKFPRIVMAAQPSRVIDESTGTLPPSMLINQLVKLPPTAPRWRAAGKIFVGFLEPAQQLEVISYNEDAGRFEFQIVKDFQKPLPSGGLATPQVEYAQRQVCISCHQHNGPIFFAAPWTDANEHPAIGKKIAAQRGGQDTYLGVKIKSLRNNFVSGEAVDASFEGSFAFAVDNSVRSGSELLRFNDLWIHMCGPGETGNRCRASIFHEQLTIAVGANLPWSGEYRNFLTTHRALLESRIIERARTIKHTLFADFFEPLNQIKIPAQDRQDRVLPKELDPLTSRRFDKNPDPDALPRSFEEQIKSIYNLTSIFHLRNRSILSDVLFNGDDILALSKAAQSRKLTPETLRNAIESLLMETQSGTSSVFAENHGYSPTALQELARHLNVTIPAEPVSPAMPEVFVEGDTKKDSGSNPTPLLKADMVQNETLKGFFTYCSPCHRHRDEDSTIPPFLGASDEEGVKERLNKFKKRIASLMEAQEMPPEGSRQFRELFDPGKEHPETESTRQAIYQNMRTLNF